MISVAMITNYLKLIEWLLNRLFDRSDLSWDFTSYIGVHFESMHSFLSANTFRRPMFGIVEILGIFIDA